MAQIMGVGRLIVTDGSWCAYSNAFRVGGCAWTFENAVMMIANGSSILHSLAEDSAGAIFIAGGTLSISNRSEVMNSTSNGAEGEGGFVMIFSGGILEITGSSAIRGSTASVGGAVVMVGGTMTIINSSIINSTAQQGAALYTSSGEVVFRNSLVIDSFAVVPAQGIGGAAVWVSGGRTTFWGSRIARSTSMAPMGPACFYLSAGELHLSYTIVEDSRSPRASRAGVGVILEVHVPQSSTGFGPLLIATFTEFRQRLCHQTPMFSQQGAAQIVLRNIQFTPLGDCDRTALSSASAFPGITTLACEQGYTDGDLQTWGVCSSTTPGACAAVSVNETSLRALTCRCPWPEFDNPDVEGTYAPYKQGVGGCIAPMRLAAMSVISQRVAIALSKPATFSATLQEAVPASMVQSLNVTLGEIACNRSYGQHTHSPCSLCLDRHPLPVTCSFASSPISQ